MKKTKDYEINLVRERNERLRHIQREKNILEKLKNSSVEHYKEIADPEYMHDEDPQSIITVGKRASKFANILLILLFKLLGGGAKSFFDSFSATGWPQRTFLIFSF